MEFLTFEIPPKFIVHGHIFCDPLTWEGLKSPK